MGANKKKKRVLAPPAELLPVLFERLNEVFFCSNANSVLVWVSPNISNLLGYSIDEFIGGDARAVYVRPDDRQALIKVATEAKGSPISFEAELRRKDGGTIWAEMSVCASFDEAGAFKGIQGVVRDITDHWQTRRTLEESEDRFHRLSDEATEAICIHFQGKIVDFNQAFETLFRYSRDEFLEMWAWDVIDPRDIPLAKEMVKQHYEEPYEVRGVRKDGSIFPMEIYSKHSWMGEKSVRVTSIRDLTIRKHTEDELRK